MAGLDELMADTEMHMMESIDALQHDLAGFRTGKASPALVEGVLVDYYGTQTRLKEIAGITAPEARLLVIQPWDKNALKAIEKALQAANLGISPVSDGRVIRLPIPELSEERRQDLVKQARRRAEEAKVSIRNHRRDANEAAKQAQKDGDFNEDDLHSSKDRIQRLTDEYIKQVDDLTLKKEQEVLKV